MKELKKVPEFNDNMKPDWFRRFGIWCSGASWEALKECPNDWNKFAFNGHIIFLTASLAFLSGTYFLSFVFPEAHGIVPLLFGLLWGFLIFTLDRIIIVSMKKIGGIWSQLIQGGLWRILLAFFIGLVIATPLELRFFQEEIKAKVELNDKVIKNQQQAEVFKRDSIQRENSKEFYNSIRKKYNLDYLETEEKNARVKYEELDKLRIAEAEGTGGTGKVGKGPVYKEKLESFEIAKTNWENADKALKEANQKYNEDVSELPPVVPPINSIPIGTNIIDGPEARVKALYQLSGLHWFITLLFILIECLPVITKLMTPRSSYDETLERIEYETMVEQKEIISQKNSEINELLIKAEEAGKLKGETFIQAQKDKLDAELKSNKIILDKIAEYQQEIALLHIENWYKTEKAKAESTIDKPKFVDIFWKQKDAIDSIEYCFRNGSVSDNELLYFENGHLSKGKWNFNVLNNEIKIDLLSNNVEYVIVEVKETRLRLKDKETNEIINFEKV